MTFEEMVAKVVLDTVRPDMGFAADGGDDRIPEAVAASTRTMHNKDYFFRDLATADLDLGQTAYIQLLDTAGLPFYRNMAYVRKWDPSLNSYALDPTILPPDWLSGTNGALWSANQASGYLRPMDPDMLFDSYGYQKQDVMYQSGSVVQMKSSTPFRWAKVGWFVFPNTRWRTGQYNSWIADIYPDAIINHAVSFVFASTGEQEMARKYDSEGGLVAQAIEPLMKSNVTFVGR